MSENDGNNKRHMIDAVGDSDNKRQRLTEPVEAAVPSNDIVESTTTPTDDGKTVDIILKSLQQLANSGDYSTAFHLLDKHLAGILLHFLQLRNLTYDATSQNFDAQRIILTFKYDVGICRVMKVVAHHTDDDYKMQVSMQFLSCMFSMSGMAAFLMDAILSLDQFMSMYWHGLLQRRNKDPNGMPLFSCQKLFKELATVPGIKTICALPTDTLTMHSYTAEAEAAADFQFKWLFGVCGLHLADLHPLPYFIRRRFDNLICERLIYRLHGIYLYQYKVFTRLHLQL